MAIATFFAANWPMLVCFIFGIVLIVAEAFMPGFGIPGISGVILEVSAVVLCYHNISPAAALGMTLLCIALLAVAVSMSLRSAAKGRLSKSAMILSESEKNDNGYRTSEDMKSFLGLVGTSTTVLRPTGMADFDGVRLNVMSDGEFIPAQTRVRVKRVEGNRVVVAAE